MSEANSTDSTLTGVESTLYQQTGQQQQHQYHPTHLQSVHTHGYPSSPLPTIAVSPHYYPSSTSVSASQSEGEGFGELKDGDGIFKLFVGQIPPFTSEETLRITFAPFGPISDVIILKDRHTGAHKGCGFVCFASRSAADRAIDTLADKVKLPHAKREMIVRFAGDRQDEKEFKLYVCMLSRHSSEAEVRAMFEPFGGLNEVFLIKSREGNQSKGAAFVKFNHREDAERAIAAIHDKVKDKDAPGMVQVRFAHTKEERAVHLNQVAGSPQAVPSPQLVSRSPPHHAHPMHSGVPSHHYQPIPYGIPFSQIPPAGMNKFGQYAVYPNAYGRGANAADYSQMQPQQYSQYHHHSHPHHPHQHQHSHHQIHSHSVPLVDPSSPQHSHYNYHPHPSHFPHHAHSHSNSHISQSHSHSHSHSHIPQQLVPVSPTQIKDVRSPDGSNLFVYNIPETFHENDLSSLFAPFGVVVSSRIQRDHATGLSKGYGFIAFDDAAAAATAIQSLDGYALGNKRLSVRVKNSPVQRTNSQSQSTGTTSNHSNYRSYQS